MNPIKYLKNLSMSLGAFVALGVVACGFVFAVAAFLRCLLFAWHKGWTLFAVMVCLLLASIGHSTPVLFPLLGITGSANNRDITVIPDPSRVPLIYGSNIVVLQTVTIHPLGGSATNNLLPWGYTIRVDGWPPAAHINVPNSTNLINVTTLITNAGAVGFPVSPTSGFTGTVTNLAQIQFNILKTLCIASVSGTNSSAANGYGTYFLCVSNSGNFLIFTNTASLSAVIFNDPNWLDESYANSSWTLNTSTNSGNWFAQNYNDNDLSVQWVAIGGDHPASLDYKATTSQPYLTTNTVQHFNITTFQNGIAMTNIFQ